MDYGPALPQRLGSDLHYSLDQNSNASKEPSKKASDRAKKTLTLTKGMRLNQGLPQINTMMNPMNLACHLLNPKNMLTRLDIRSGPDMCHLPQRTTSPLQPDTGLQSPLGPSPLGLSDQDQPQHDPDPPYYREVALSDVPSQYAEEVDTFKRILSLCLGPQLQLGSG